MNWFYVKKIPTTRLSFLKCNIFFYSARRKTEEIRPQLIRRFRINADEI